MPVLVDPYVAEDQRFWIINPNLDFNGWRFNQAGGAFGGFQGASGFGRGQYLFSNPGQNYVNANGGPAFAQWIFDAPFVPGFEAEGARIIKADFGQTVHTVSDRGSCITEAIFSRNPIGPEVGGIFRNASTGDPYTGYQAPYGYINCGPEGVPGQGQTYGYKVHCLSVCGLDGGNPTKGTPGNAAVLSILQGAGVPGRGGVVYQGSSLIFMSEQAAPRMTGNAAPAGWTDQAFTLNNTATDYGLGMYRQFAAAPGFAGSTANGNCDGAQPSEGGPEGSANTGDRNRRCPRNLSSSISSTQISEGSSNATFRAIDVVDNEVTRNVPVKIDRSAPSVAFSGALFANRSSEFNAEQDLMLSVTANDGSLSGPGQQRAGVAKLDVSLDSGPLPGGALAPGCVRPEGSCSITADFSLTSDYLDTLASGTHNVTATATDTLGQARSETFTFRLDTVEPSIELKGDLLDLQGRTITGDTYRLAAEAADNHSTIETPNDPGSGLRDLVVRLDGSTVPTTPISCFAGMPCEDAREWSWDTRSTANGSHEVTVTAADKAGNQTVESFAIDLQRAPDQASRTTTPRRTLQGASPNDRLGSAVANIGDVNNDGLADQLVGAPGVSAAGRSAAGTAYILLGQAGSGIVSVADPASGAIPVLGPSNDSACGTAVAAAGDVNGDGFNDMLVGCPGFDPRSGSVLPVTGRVYVIFGRRDPRPVDLAAIGTAGFAITGPTDTPLLGLPLLASRPAVFGERLQSVVPDAGTNASDVNGDGLSDIAVGDSATTRDGNSNVGSAYVIFGKRTTEPVATGDLDGHGITISGGTPNSLTGYSAAIVGDLNGDGRADVAVGAPGATTTNQGRVHVVLGSSTPSSVDLVNPASAITLSSASVGDRFGVGVSGLGDTDFRGNDDLAVASASTVEVIRRLPSSGGTVSVADGFRITGPTNDPGPLARQVPETTLAPAGDVDGDERLDLAVGYPDASPPRTALIRSPEGSSQIAVTSLPGQHGTTGVAGEPAGRPGAALGASAFQRQASVSEPAQLLIGAPAAARSLLQPATGAVYLLSDAAPSGPGTLPDSTEAPPDPNLPVISPDSAAPDQTGADTDPGPIESTNGVDLEPEVVATTARSKNIPGRYTIRLGADPSMPDKARDWATLRNRAKSFVVGNAFTGSIFDVKQRSKQTARGTFVSYFGRLGGNVDACGWLLIKNAPGSGSPTVRGKCGSSILPETKFASLINCDVCNGASSTRLLTYGNDPLGDKIPLYRNLRRAVGNRKEKGLSQIGFLRSKRLKNGQPDGVGTKVAWRYVSRRGDFALIRSISGFGTLNDWGFVERKYLPPDTGGNIPTALCGTSEPVGTRDDEEGHFDWPPVCFQDAPPKQPGAS